MNSVVGLSVGYYLQGSARSQPDYTGQARELIPTLGEGRSKSLERFAVDRARGRTRALPN